MQASVGTPLTPPEPGQGPPCGCGDPTVLTDVNGRSGDRQPGAGCSSGQTHRRCRHRRRSGAAAPRLTPGPPMACCRKLYVCQRWPHHHCSSWCPAEVALVPLRPATAGATEAAATDEEPASPKALQPPPASQQDGAVDSAENGQAEPASPLPQAGERQSHCAALPAGCRRRPLHAPVHACCSPRVATAWPRPSRCRECRGGRGGADSQPGAAHAARARCAPDGRPLACAPCAARRLMRGTPA